MIDFGSQCTHVTRGPGAAAAPKCMPAGLAGACIWVPWRPAPGGRPRPRTPSSRAPIGGGYRSVEARSLRKRSNRRTGRRQELRRAGIPFALYNIYRQGGGGDGRRSHPSTGAWARRGRVGHCQGVTRGERSSCLFPFAFYLFPKEMSKHISRGDISAAAAAAAAEKYFCRKYSCRRRRRKTFLGEIFLPPPPCTPSNNTNGVE